MWSKPALVVGILILNCNYTYCIFSVIRTNKFSFDSAISAGKTLLMHSWSDLQCFISQSCDSSCTLSALNKLLLKMGVIFRPPGEVFLAENTCKTAVTEMCSHVGVLLFWVWVIVPCKDSQTVTNRSANCILLSNVNKEHAEVCHKKDYTSAFARRIKLNCQLDNNSDNRKPWNLCLKKKQHHLCSLCQHN